MKNPSDMRLGSVQRREECNSERAGEGKESDAGRLWSVEEFSL